MDDYKALVEELHLLREPFSYSGSLGVRAALAVEALVAENEKLRDHRSTWQRKAESQRSRIAALEAVIAWALEALVVVQTVDGWVDPIDRARAIAKARGTLSAAPSTVLDGMIREAKAEGWDEGYGDDNDVHTPRTNPYRNGDA